MNKALTQLALPTVLLTALGCGTTKENLINPNPESPRPASGAVAGEEQPAPGDDKDVASESEDVPADRLANKPDFNGNKAPPPPEAAEKRSDFTPAKPAPRQKLSRRPSKSLHGRAGGMRAQSMVVPLADANGTESYKDYGSNPMTVTAEDRKSTFAVDVDTASYAIARRKIMDGLVPPAASVRVEEFVNYFRYDYAGPTTGKPFAVHMDGAVSPFRPDRHLFRVGVQAKKLPAGHRKPAHLVFLVDVSGSMHSPDKLGLAKRALRILVQNLRSDDTVALVTYAGNTRVVQG